MIAPAFDQAPGILDGFPAPVRALAHTAGDFAAATAELRLRRELLRRIDTKFVVTAPVAVEIITAVLPHYAALSVPAGNVAVYRSLYFDTDELICFHDHRRGRRIRHKIRVRHYPDRALSFLEVKTKRNEWVTDKHRMPRPFGHEHLGADELAFLRGRVDLPVERLHPVMRVDFHRVTLVAFDSNERVTIDFGLTASDLDERTWSFGERIVIEVKQSPFCVRTPMMRALFGSGAREQSMSKYTIATATLYPELRRNRLLPDLKALERMLP